MKINPEIRDKILNAANSLQAECVETPTNEQIREYIGGRLVVAHFASYAGMA